MLFLKSYLSNPSRILMETMEAVLWPNKRVHFFDSSGRLSGFYLFCVEEQSRFCSRVECYTIHSWLIDDTFMMHFRYNCNSAIYFPLSSKTGILTFTEYWSWSLSQYGTCVWCIHKALIIHSFVAWTKTTLLGLDYSINNDRKLFFLTFRFYVSYICYMYAIYTWHTGRVEKNAKCLTSHYIVSIISHCASRALSENSARYDVILYATVF